MKIATFNVNGIKSRLPHLLEWLEREQPDVACLQELKALDETFPIDAIRAVGYHALWKGQRSWNGIAILARREPVEIRRELPGDPQDEQAATWKRPSMASLSGACTCPTATPSPARSSRTSSRGSSG